jgi:hypothetical protein
VEPQYDAAGDASSGTNPPQHRRLGWLTAPETWIIAAASTAALVLAGGVLLALWWLLMLLMHLLGALGHVSLRLGDQLATGPITRTVTDPVHTYLTQHTAGLPATAGQLWAGWLTATAVLFLTAWLGSRGARVGWVLIGATTTAMTWAGSPGSGRELAGGVAVVLWSLLSVLAFTGAGRARLTTLILPDRPDRSGRPADSPESADNASPAQPAQAAPVVPTTVPTS